jgi:hypothetical protein
LAIGFAHDVHAPGDRWFVDEIYVKINGVWRYVYRAIDQDGQVIDVLVSAHRDANAARRFFCRALVTLKMTPAEVVTDAAPVYLAVLDELIPSAWHHVERYANNRIEADHGQLNIDYGQCAAYAPTAQPPSSSPDTRSCRTYDAATTNSDWAHRPPYRSPPRSTTRTSDPIGDRSRGSAANRRDNATATGQ